MASTSKEYQLAVKIAGSVSSSFTSAMGTAESKVTSLGSVVSKVAAAAAAAWSALKIGEFFSDAVDTYSEFEQAMANTAAIASATADEYEALENAALEMGKSTTKTATECAEALGYMSLAGWDVSESIASLESVLRLSEATEMDLATCSDLVTDSMSALGLEVSDLSEYLDICVAANNNANTTAEDLMEALIGCGGAAKTVGASLTDTATALGVLANNGTKGSEAGTALNSVLARISSNDSAIKALDALGVSAFDTSGEFVGLKEFLVQVQGAMADLSTEQQAYYLKQIAGTNYFTEMSYLLDSVADSADGTASAWDTLSYALENSEGALDAMADTVTDTLSGAKSRLESAVDDLKINLVSTFAPIAKDAINSVAATIPTITEKVKEVGSSFVNYLVPKVQAFGEAVTPALEKVGTAFSTIGSVITSHADTFESLGSMAAAAINLIGDAVEAATPYISSLIDTVLSLVGKFADIATEGLEFEGALQLIVAAWATFKVGSPI
ncbi:MAG: phage tail tape measure protein, partial [Lachnospiraceae bacterium]|nr:phage tail tape measure protein [Lachnospiraceae bacterium]